ncbi:MAG: ABC transporter permease [Candidatus Micrarchaeia archaeon]
MPKKVANLLMLEVNSAKRSVVFLSLLILIPITFGVLFGTFKQIVPKSAPSAVVSVGGNEEDVRFASAVVSLFSNVRIENEISEAKLYREELYFIVGVSEGISKGAGNVTIYIDNAMSPVYELSTYAVEIIMYELTTHFSHVPKIYVKGFGTPVLPNQFFTPGIILLFAIITGLLIVPFTTRKDWLVYSRLTTIASPIHIVISKMVFAFAIVLIQTILLLLTEYFFGLPLIKIDGTFLITLFITCVYLSLTGLLVSFLSRFSIAGQVLNVLLAGFLLVFSGLFYPVGFLPRLPVFGDILQTIPKFMPTYYSAILMRSFAIREAPLAIFYDYVGIITITALVLFVMTVYVMGRYR